jgi:xylulokinase
MVAEGFLLGYDLGSSSIKASLIEAATGTVISSASSPDTEMRIRAAQAGWAEQEPEEWWKEIKKATAKLRAAAPPAFSEIKAIGISYQMHGLVLVDKDLKALRPSIIWCDSRAAKIGEDAFHALGEERCLAALLNSPGNFTAAKLKWVKDNEPRIFAKIKYAMLPGDYIALRLTGEPATTASGLSEAILWDFAENKQAKFLLQHFEIPLDIFPALVPSAGFQGKVIAGVAAELGLPAGVAVTYRAGDQPNNALSLNVLNLGEVAATAGTSAVVYGVGKKIKIDPHSRVNTFLHVNHAQSDPRLGVLLCINGAGALNRWLKDQLFNSAKASAYADMDKEAATVNVGCDGLVMLPFGNGAERILKNQLTSASIRNLELNIHTRAHLLRAAQEAIAFSLVYGIAIMREMGIPISMLRAGRANMFLSPLFREILATSADVSIELFNTDGSEGAARAAGVGAGVYRDYKQAFSSLKKILDCQPQVSLTSKYAEAYNRWCKALNESLSCSEREKL